MIHSAVIRQIISYHHVGRELEDFLSTIQYTHKYKVISVIETKISSNECTQGFIVIYDDLTDIDDIENGNDDQ